MTADDRTPSSEIVLYQSEDGHTRIQCRFEDCSIWLAQRLMWYHPRYHGRVL